MKKIVKRMVGVSILLIGATFMMNFLSCGKKTDVSGGGSAKEFEVSYIKIWGVNVNLKKESLTANVKGDASEKNLEVKIANSNRFKMEYKMGSLEGSTGAMAGEATVDPFEVPKGKTKLFITITDSGFNTFKKSIKIMRTDPPAPDVHVGLKRTEDSNPIEVINGKEYPTSGDSVAVVVSSNGKAVMKKVTIAGEDVELANGGKKAEKANIAIGSNVEVTVEFESYQEIKRTFSLKKVNSGEVPVTVVSAVIRGLSGEETEKSLTFDESNTATIELDNIEYSCVKLVMNADVELESSSSKLVECKDQRSANYSTNSNKEDLKGIFSGRLIKEFSAEGEETVYGSVSYSTLTEHLIVAFGTVTYTFNLNATGRKETKYTVEITNLNDKKVLFAGQNAHFHYGSGYPYSPLLSGSPVWQMMYQSQLPINSKTDEDFLKKSDLEYMGDDVSLTFMKFNESNKTGGVKGEMYFYYTLFDDPSSKVREFTRIKGKIYDGYPDEYYVEAKFNPEEKYLDAFVAFQDLLPQPLLPLQIQKKWKKIVKKGFLFQVENRLEYNIGGRKTPAIKFFYDAFPYRIQAKVHEKNEFLCIGLKQKYQNFLDGSEQDLSSTPFLHGGKIELKGEDGQPNGKHMPGDLMTMWPTFSGAMSDSISSLTYTIKKNGVLEVGWRNVSLSPSKWTRFFCLNAKDANMEGGKLNSEGMYTYEKGTQGSENVYEIEVTMKLAGGESQTFKYKIDYKDEQKSVCMSLDNEPSVDSNLFGVPVSYAEVANSEVMWRYFARKALIK